MNIRIREIRSSDLPKLFDFQLDSDANRMAYTHPRSKQEFDHHWQRILDDSEVVVRAIDSGDTLAGTISCFACEGKHYVGYWIGPSFWGKGIATAALKLLLTKVALRPLHSRVAATNVASIRVLEKCGFQEVGREWSPATERFIECDEVIMELSE